MTKKKLTTFGHGRRAPKKLAAKGAPSKAPEPKGKTTRQGELPGLERKRVKAIDRAADEYQRDKRAMVASTAQFKKSKEHLLSVLLANGMAPGDIYVDREAIPPLVVKLVPRDATPDVRVSEIDEEDIETVVEEARTKRQDQPLGEDTMARPSEANRKLATGREEIAEARASMASGDPAGAARDREAFGGAEDVGEEEAGDDEPTPDA